MISESFKVEPHTLTPLLECRCQREEIGSEEAEVSVLHVIPYDRDQPAAWELQVVPGENNTRTVIQTAMITRTELHCVSVSTYSKPVMLRGTAPSTTSGPMLSTAPPTARSNSPLKGKWGVERRSASDCRDCSRHDTNTLRQTFLFLCSRGYLSSLRLYLGHDGVSLFPCDSIEAAEDLQNKRPGGMEAIRQSFLHDAETHKKTHIHNHHNWSLQKGLETATRFEEFTETFCRHRRGFLQRLWQWRCPFPPCKGQRILSTKSETHHINKSANRTLYTLWNEN